MDALAQRLSLDAKVARRLEGAARCLGGLDTLSRAWPPWQGFAYYVLPALAAKAELELAGDDLDLADLLALGPEPAPNRPNHTLRRAVGVILAWRRLEAWPQDSPLTPSLVTEILPLLDAPHLARTPSHSTPESPGPAPGAPVWSLAPRWVQGGLPPLWAAGLALATWEREGPDHPNRSLAGRALLCGLAPRLGLPAQAFCGLGAWLSQAAQEHSLQLGTLIKQVRRTGAWRRFMEVFLTAVEKGAGRVRDISLQAQELEFSHQELVDTWVRAPRHPQRLLALLVRRPVLDVPSVAEQLEVTQRTAGLLLQKLKDLGLVKEITGQSRGRRFAYIPLLEILQPGWDRRGHEDDQGPENGDQL
ncbi:MAG: helix-turn-helix domain-containing protein [Desulfarculaceae bacterium]|jgi:hypothetical protein